MSGPCCAYLRALREGVCRQVVCVWGEAALAGHRRRERVEESRSSCSSRRRFGGVSNLTDPGVSPTLPQKYTERAYL